ncbi:ABC transporter G family member 23 [Linum perenne]
MSSCFNPPPPPHPAAGEHSGDQSTSYHLTVTNLSFTITPTASFWQPNPTPITILKSVTFHAGTSQILAVVGPSGTGKSTLLRYIAGRVRDSEFDPSAVTINGRGISTPSQLRKICGFVPQEDNLLPLLTVRETLMYGSKFSLREMTMKEKEEKVDSLLIELGLVHVADSFVGGISGGERKRVSIGDAMICDPPILVLDEPTSGLDSGSAVQVIEQLSAIAGLKKRTIVISIHQPGYRIIRLIPNFLILSRGCAVHNGNLESLEDLIVDLGFRIPDQLNPLEFAMEILQSLEESAKSEIRIPPESVTRRRLIWQEATKNPKLGSSGGENFSEIANLCSRSWKIIYRTKQLLAARTIQALIGGFGLGSVYIKLPKNSDSDDGKGEISQRLGLFAFSLSFLLSSTVEALPIYLQERRVLMKEASRGSYKISNYMIANTIIFLPFLLIVALLFSVPVYSLVGLNPEIAAFGFFALTVWLIILMANSLVMFLSAISPDFIVGNSLICTVLGAFFLFSDTHLIRC